MHRGAVIVLLFNYLILFLVYSLMAWRAKYDAHDFSFRPVQGRLYFRISFCI